MASGTSLTLPVTAVPCSLACHDPFFLLVSDCRWNGVIDRDQRTRPDYLTFPYDRLSVATSGVLSMTRAEALPAAVERFHGSSIRKTPGPFGF